MPFLLAANKSEYVAAYKKRCAGLWRRRTDTSPVEEESVGKRANSHHQNIRAYGMVCCSGARDALALHVPWRRGFESRPGPKACPVV